MLILVIPAVIVGVSFPLIGEEYATTWTCWGDLENSLIWGLFGPMAVICAVALILDEAAGLMSRTRSPLPQVDLRQLTSAR